MGRVVVIGNAGLDLGLAVPHLPRPGETLVGTPSPRAPGGKGLNQAVVAARYGARVTFCAPLGNDDSEAQEIERHLAREGFAQLILPRLPYPTDFSLLMVLPNGENAIVSTSACSLALKVEQARPALGDLTTDEVVLVQGQAQQLQDIANELVTLRGVLTGKLQLLAAVIPPLTAGPE